MIYNDWDGITQSSKQGPQIPDSSYSSCIIKASNSLYAHMFFDDFCADYSIVLRPKLICNNFYEFDGDYKKFQNLFGYDFLDYELDKILSNLVENLLVFGKAYIERVYWYDDEKNLKKITYQCINCRSLRMCNHNLVYKVKDEKGEVCKGKIKEKNILVFDLRELGFSKKFFIKKLKKFRKLEFPDAELSLNKAFSLDKYKAKTEIYLLKLMKRIYWNGRNSENQFFTEPYLVYRIMMHQKLQNDFLEYFINKINTDIRSIGKTTGFTGKIEFESITQNYDSLIGDLKTGKKNCEQVGNVIFKGI